MYFPIPYGPGWEIRIGIGLVISTVLTKIVSGFVVWILKQLIRHGAIDP